MTAPAHTPLYDWHVAHGGRMVDFAGWSMPVQYASIVAEHVATRTAVGLFDVSHMARLYWASRSPDAREGAAFLEGLLTRRVCDMRPGQIRYSLVTNDAGFVLDDVLVYLLEFPGRGLFHVVVANASNRQKIADHLESQLPADGQLRLTDQTEKTAMIAVQGPRALELAQPLVAHELAALKNYTGAVTTILGKEAIVSRTGYTGEDGCELIVPRDVARQVWETLLDRGQSLGAVAAGLGARDTLRLEAAMPLYGHELEENIDPLEAGLGFAVQLEGRRFPGRDAIAQRKANPTRVRIGLAIRGKRPARQGSAVLHAGQSIGQVTSGTFSPTLQKPIAMALVPPSLSAVGTPLSVDIRGSVEEAVVVKLPFYTRNKGVSPRPAGERDG